MTLLNFLFLMVYDTALEIINTICIPCHINYVSCVASLLTLNNHKAKYANTLIVEIAHYK